MQYNAQNTFLTALRLLQLQLLHINYLQLNKIITGSYGTRIARKRKLFIRDR